MYCHRSSSHPPYPLRTGAPVLYHTMHAITLLSYTYNTQRTNAGAQQHASSNTQKHAEALRRAQSPHHQIEHTITHSPYQLSPLTFPSLLYSNNFHLLIILLPLHHLIINPRSPKLEIGLSRSTEASPTTSQH